MAATRYSALRNQLMRQSFPSVFAPVVLRDADSNYVPIPISERLVQCIWYDQRLQTDQLRATNGRAIRVIDPGWWNLEAGPDFRHATVQIGDEPELTGDVEIHLRADDWTHHAHERDPQYNNVILHVVLWEAGAEFIPKTSAGDLLPQLILQDKLAAPLESLYDEVDLDAYPHAVHGHTGRCAPVLHELPADGVTALLEAAGDERFAVKMRKFTRWIHRAGAAQAFYEGWMEALGYKSNKIAFRTLAQRLPLADLPLCGSALPGATGGESRPEGRSHNKNKPFDLTALHFGVANFLPTAAPNARDIAGKRYVKRLWSTWWKLRPDLADKIMSAETWRFHGIRPANHPHRRLGAAVAMLHQHGEGFLEKIVGAIASDGDPEKFFADIRDDYWSTHFTLGGKGQARPGELIGTARAQEIVTNIILPFVAAYAQTGSDEKLFAKAMTRYAALRSAPANSVVRLAGEQLFGPGKALHKFVKTTRQQQGLMQIFQDFCLNDRSACQHCQFPELVRRWANHQ